MEILATLEKIEKFRKKYPVQKDFEQRTQSYFDLCRKYTASMIETLKKVKEFTDEEPWEPINFPKIKKDGWFPDIFEEFAQRRGYYKNYPTNYSLKNLNLKEAILYYTNLKRTCLREVYLRLAKLTRVNFEGADCYGVDFSSADITDANFSGANLEGVDFYEANIENANFDGANLKGVKHLTKEQLHSARNWEKARGIPKELL